MARTLTTYNQTETAKTVTIPRYLVQLHFTTVLYLSTRDAVTYDGKSYVANGVNVETVNTDGAVITLANSDLSASALILGEGVKDKLVIVYQLYGMGYTDADAVELFRGYMSDANIRGMRASINCERYRVRVSKTPRHYCAPPVCNHLVAPGTRIGNIILE